MSGGSLQYDDIDNNCFPTVNGTNMKNILQMKFFPANTDAALLALRVINITAMFLKHGQHKIFAFSTLAARFPDPVGIGRFPSFIFSIFADVICAILMVIGLGTRWAALISFINLIVAWIFYHHFLFMGPNADRGELVVLYLGSTLTLLFAGPGKYSVDALISKHREANVAPQSKFNVKNSR